MLVVICVVVFGKFGVLAVVVGGCSWLASCCWVVVLGWQWLWIVPLIDLCFFFFFGSGMYYFIMIFILFYFVES